jgi:ribosomal protein S18 acetylase RimI-like enzyme
MPLRLEPLGDSNLDPASNLLAVRHAAHREHEPLLPVLDDPSAAVREALGKEGATGLVARRGGEVVAYLILRQAKTSYWGPPAWVDEAGYAFSDAEAVRDLYAALAPAAVEAGARLHLALVPAVAELEEPWFRLAFGHMQVQGLRRSGAPEPVLPADTVIRPGTAEDLHAALPLKSVITNHQRGSPTYTGLPEPDERQVLSDWQETLPEPDVVYRVAEQRGRIVGFVLLYDLPASLSRPAGAIHLATLATVPEVRGQGIGVALANHALREAAAAGRDVVDVDWRMANLEASRFWPSRGFRPTFHRLHRVLNSG